MVTYLLKKSYQLKDLKQIEFQDLWGDHGIFTTMWIFGKPAKILFFDSHLKNLILSLKKYQIDTIIYWYDILPLFTLWIINELVIKLRYKCLSEYSKREHVLFILAEIVGIDEYNVVRIISDYMGPENLADFAIVQEGDLVTLQPLSV